MTVAIQVTQVTGSCLLEMADAVKKIVDLEIP